MMQGTLFENVFFPNLSEGFKAPMIVELGDMIKVPDNVCEWIKESCKNKEDLEVFGTTVILKYCFYRVQGAFILANLQYDKCIDYDKRGFAFNVGLMDEKTNDEILMYCVHNSKSNPPFKFYRWIRKSKFKSRSVEKSLDNPFAILKKFAQELDCVENWKDDITKHFREDHLERLPFGYSVYELVQGFKESLRNLRTRPDKIEPFVHDEGVQYLVPISFGYGQDYELYAVCSVKIDGDTATFSAITKYTKEMVRQKNLLTLFDKEHADWMSPSNDNVDMEKQVSKIDPIDNVMIRKTKIMRISILKKLIGCIISGPKFVCSIVLRKLKLKG